jgi:Zn-dependent M28 family amino/carboxypeptidase
MHAASTAWRPLAATLAGLLTCALGGSLDAAPASDSTAAALRDNALRGTRAYDIVSSLTTEIGPRPAGSEAFQRAVEWGLRTMKELGFQNVRAEKVILPHWDIGTGEGRITAPWPQPMVLAALGGSLPTPEAGIDAEVVQVASLEALQALDPAKARGKIVFLDKRMERRKDGSGYGETVPGRGAGSAVSAKLGAVAFLIRSVGTDNNRTPHTGAMRIQAGEPQVPAAALSNPDADVLEKEIASGKPVTFHLKLTSRSLPEVESANVVGDIPGREKPDEIVLLGCHLDSWPLGTGAIDDGAGCAIMLEAARRIGELKEKPRRTIRVVLFANEEFGLSGAQAYAKEHAAELPKHILAGESDFGSGKVWRLSSRVAPETLPAMDAIAGILAPLGVERGSNDSSGGADLSPMAPAKVPILSLGQDGTYYFDWHHTANDTLDKIDPKDLDQNVAAWAAAAWMAANMPGDFGRAPEATGGE